jgi:hypothetical protein
MKVRFIVSTNKVGSECEGDYYFDEMGSGEQTMKPRKHKPELDKAREEYLRAIERLSNIKIQLSVQEIVTEELRKRYMLEPRP